MWLKKLSLESSSQQKLIREHCALLTCHPRPSHVGKGIACQELATSGEIGSKWLSKVSHNFCWFSNPFCQPATEKVLQGSQIVLGLQRYSTVLLILMLSSPSSQEAMNATKMLLRSIKGNSASLSFLALNEWAHLSALIFLIKVAPFIHAFPLPPMRLRVFLYLDLLLLWSFWTTAMSLKGKACVCYPALLLFARLRGWQRQT